MRVAGIGAVLAAGTVVAAGAAGAAESSGEPGPAPAPPPFANDFAANVPRDAGTAAAAPSQAEVAASSVAFVNQTDAEALATVEGEFGEVLAAELIPELDLPEGSKIGRFLDSSTALIVPEDANQQRAMALSGEPSDNLLLDSPLPLRAPENGSPRPLDGDLERVGDHYEADNPLVDSDIAVDLEDGASLSAAGIEMIPEGVEPTQGVPVEDKVFYPNAENDSDYLVAPTATGFEVFFQLRSPDSPEEFRLTFGGDGATTLRLAPDGSVEVDVDSVTQATVASPAAFDAVGQAVPVHYEIDGATLKVVVPHSDSETYQWPILVDPIVDDYNWGANQPDPDISFWDKGTNFANGFNSFYATSQGGLMNRAIDGRSYPTNSFGQWVGSSIRWSYIERVDYLNWDHSPTQPGACTIMGIYQPWQGAFAPTTVYNPATGATNYTAGQGYCGNLAHQSRSFYVGANAMPDGPGGDPEAAAMSQAIFQLSSSPGMRGSPAENLLRGVKVFRYDDMPTSITSPVPTSSWTRYPAALSVQDYGLGAAGVWVFQNGTFNLIGYGANGCTGGRKSLCPTNDTFSVSNLPEGRYDALAIGIDPILNGGSGQQWTSRVDRTGPEISFGGSLKANEDQPLPAGAHSLVAVASDGSLANASTERSGTVDLRIYVDRELVASSSSGCAQSSCALSSIATVATQDLEPGPHLVEAVATDAAGNQSTDCFGTNKTTPTSRLTRFTLRHKIPMAYLAQEIAGAGQGPAVQSMDYEAANSSGGHVFGSSPFLEEVHEYRQILLADVLSNEPEIRSVTFHGRVSSTVLGQFASEVDQRSVSCPDVTITDPLPAKSEASLFDSAEGDRLYARDAAGLPDDPDAERGQFQSHHFAPFKGKVVTHTIDVQKADGDIVHRRMFHHTLRWATRSSLEDFQCGDSDDDCLDYAYEHDFKLQSPEGDVPGFGQPNCNEEDYFWATRKGLTHYDNFPAGTHANTDIALFDNCNKLDFTFGMEYPRNLEPDVLYFMKIVSHRGQKPRGAYALTGVKMDRDCSTDWRYCTDYDGAGTQLFVGDSKGDVPECRLWRKGRISKKC